MNNRAIPPPSSQLSLRLCPPFYKVTCHKHKATYLHPLCVSSPASTCRSSTTLAPLTMVVQIIIEPRDAIRTFVICGAQSWDRRGLLPWVCISPKCRF